MKNVKQLLPKGSKELIKKALTLYKNSIEIINRDGEGEMIDDDINYDHFDCIGLIGMMNYDVEVTLPNESKEYFSGKHNVDFPMFGEVETSSKNVSILGTILNHHTGDIKYM